MRQFRLVERDKMAGSPGELEPGVREVPAEPVGPFGLQDRIVAAPQEIAGVRDFRDLDRALPHHAGTEPAYADVPVEAALKIARPREIIDPFLEVRLERLLLTRPVPQEIPEVDPHRLAARADQ